MNLLENETVMRTEPYDEATATDTAKLTTIGQFDDGQCAICLVDSQIDKSFLLCGHVFCLKCLVAWCRIKLECPTCKQCFQKYLVGDGEKEEYDAKTHKPITYDGQLELEEKARRLQKQKDRRQGKFLAREKYGKDYTLSQFYEMILFINPKSEIRKRFVDANNFYSG